MALESVPSSSADLASSRATRTHQRIRKDERTWTTETFAPYDDGHQWRKYGEKKLSNSKFPRFYYRCTYKNDMKCPATKQVQQKDCNDPPTFSVTYFNQHTCNSNSIGIGAPELAMQSSSRKAVSISFNSYTAKEQKAFLSSSAAMPSPAVRSYETSQQVAPPSSDRSCSDSKSARDWSMYPHIQLPSTPSPSIAPVKMEVEEIHETGVSPTTGALSRTLLPIGQSRCIEYFHFL